MDKQYSEYIMLLKDTIVTKNNDRVFRFEPSQPTVPSKERRDIDSRSRIACSFVPYAAATLLIAILADHIGHISVDAVVSSKIRKLVRAV